MIVERRPPCLADEDFQFIRDLMFDASGISMADHKRSLVAGRLMPRLRALGLCSYADYVQQLRSAEQPGERRLLIDLLTTNETSFFREPAHFEMLGRWVEEQNRPLHVWSAAGSSGQEAFSIAMTLAEHCSSTSWSIIGSDISRKVMEQARRAVYPMAQASQFPPGWLERYCLRGIGASEGLFRIAEPIRQRVEFGEINLIQPLPASLGPFDVIFLRNLLIYFDRQHKRLILAQLLERLRVGGLLFISHAENVQGMALPLRAVQPSIFERL
ncbi:SAM-dependent methyltransferase [Stutzerimonas stutzeri]|uniref:Chemotaxis protein methyltransferase n=1 Tax=Stutzerimonas stutzeri TaxID=316 RepID=W8RTI7_STUST|nr:protein-glutamate O-methyltransferase CheR [Stutzerimonas stutzeri]AHL75376.1 SAM-dependent methyltransferase [Stutzerimonas stutzeri]MCQ4328068.1 protein-glutamate O-methyltransferase CheR [Stutzerimonas stutzeri]